MNSPLAQELRFFPYSHFEQELKEMGPELPHPVIYSSMSVNDRRISTPSLTPPLKGMPAFVTRRNELQIIASRNIRTNLRLSLMMALRMAHASQSKATGFMAQGWVWEADPRFRPATDEEKAKTGMDSHPIFDYAAPPSAPNAWKNSEDVRVLYVNSYARPQTIADEISWITSHGHADARQDIPLAFVHAPIGTWPEKMLEIRKFIMDNQFTVLILNAFEFVTLTSRQKHELSIELLRLQDELAVTVIVFTQDVRKGMEAGIMGRGPIGRLQALAGSVVVIENDEGLFDGAETEWESWFLEIGIGVGVLGKRARGIGCGVLGVGESVAHAASSTMLTPPVTHDAIQLEESCSEQSEAAYSIAA